MDHITTLDPSLQALREYFNGYADHLRCVAMVSPTCAPCLDGARAVSRAVLDAYPQAEIAAAIVWIPMLEGDTQAAAHRAASVVNDPRAHHFYDEQRWAGQAIASTIGGAGRTAWDVYLLYTPGSVWEKHPPAPAAWMHQLDADWIDPNLYFTGDTLPFNLRTAAEQLLMADSR